MRSSDIQIERQISQTRCEEVYNFRLDINKNDQVDYNEWKEYYSSMVKDRQNALIVLALADSGRYVVGLVAGEIISSSDVIGFFAKNVVLVSNLAVKADYRRIGIAKKLMSELGDWGTFSQLDGLLLSTKSENTRARNFHLSLGFNEIGTKYLKNLVAAGLCVADYKVTGMTKHEIVPLSSELIPDAAQLLYDLYVWHHYLEPETFQAPCKSRYNSQIDRLTEALASSDIGVFVAVDSITCDRIAVITCYIQRMKSKNQAFTAQCAAFIGDIFVKETYRGQGIGASLIKACEKWAGEKGASEIAITVRHRNDGMLRLVSNLEYQCMTHWLTKKL